MRRTKQRATILRVLRGTDQHPTANWIYSEVRKELPHVSLGTVYRTLHALAQEGTIRILTFGDGPHRYDGRPGTHDHIVCTVCGRTADVPQMVAVNARTEIERRTDYTVSSLRLTWHGLCSDCRVKQEHLELEGSVEC